MLGSLRFRTAAAYILLIVAAFAASLFDVDRSILIAVVVTAAVAGILSLAIGSTIMRPLGQLARTARSIASGNLGERVVYLVEGKIGELNVSKY